LLSYSVYNINKLIKKDGSDRYSGLIFWTYNNNTIKE
jgi:hypothetical protein